MITGAICGFAVAVNSGSPLVGFVAAAGGARRCRCSLRC